jgi:hypothetical protein
MILSLKQQCAKGSEIVGFSPAKPQIEVLRREPKSKAIGSVR